MKTQDLKFEFDLMNAAPEGSHLDNRFTDRVMEHLPGSRPLSAHLPTKNKATLWYRFKHLSGFTLVILAITALCVASTVTYAIVETIKQQTSVKLDTSGVNEFGREQLSVTFDSCAEQKKKGTTYELKKDSGLSAEDGAKVLQAQCERDSIIEWIKKDPILTKHTTNVNTFNGSLSIDGFVGTFQKMTEGGIALHSTTAFSANARNQTLPFPQDARIVEDGKVVDQTHLEPSNTILYFSPRERGTRSVAPSGVNVVVFKLNLAAKYYGLDMRSYVRARQPCSNNEAYTCIVSNSINTVVLEVSRGGAPAGTNDLPVSKTIQGKVVSWNNQQITLDVGKGVLYTLGTRSNVIDTYNQTTVYGLRSYDTIYAKTDPEMLKIDVGDSLEVYYGEVTGQSARAVEWSQIYGINLMVERRVDKLDVLRKY